MVNHYKSFYGAGRGMIEDTAGDGGVGSTGAGGGMMEDTADDGMSEGCVILSNVDQVRQYSQKSSVKNLNC